MMYSDYYRFEIIDHNGYTDLINKHIINDSMSQIIFAYIVTDYITDFVPDYPIIIDPDYLHQNSVRLQALDLIGSEALI
jgi:hypothetical protein